MRARGRGREPFRRDRERAGGVRCRGRLPLGGLAVVLICSLVLAASAPPARASTIGTLCSIGGIFSGLVEKACDAVSKGGSVLSAGEKLIGLGGTAARLTGLAASAVAVAGGARAALHEAARVIGATTTPRLTSRWFSSAYLRMAALAALLTLPFLFAAAVQALIRSDLAMLLRAAFGYLPLAVLLVAIAAPMTMLLLAASDEMSNLVAAAAGRSSASLLTTTGRFSAILQVTGGSLFLGIVMGVLLLATAIAVTLELVVREAAVYVVVLMLPLAFAALVWPARRVWAARLLELLVALILSKFVIVAVLALAGSGIAQISGFGIGAALAGTALLALAAFSPLVLMRLLPFAELAGAAGGGGVLLPGAAQGTKALLAGELAGGSVEGWLTRTTGEPPAIKRPGLTEGPSPPPADRSGDSVAAMAQALPGGPQPPHSPAPEGDPSAGSPAPQALPPASAPIPGGADASPPPPPIPGGADASPPPPPIPGGADAPPPPPAIPGRADAPLPLDELLAGRRPWPEGGRLVLGDEPGILREEGTENDQGQR
jgi:hypothetical protein